MGEPGGTEDDTHDGRARRLFRRRFVSILVVAFLFRCGYALIVKKGDRVAGDELYYTAQAIEIAEGNGFVNPFDTDAYSAGHAPATAALLAPVSWIDSNVLTEQRILMVLYGTVVVALVGLIARHLFDRRTALTAAVAASAYAGFWLNDVLILSETLAAAGVAAILGSAYLHHDRRSMSTAALVGASAAFAGLARTELIALGGLVGFVVIVAGARADRDPVEHDRSNDSMSATATAPATRAGHLLVSAVLALALIAPWVIRNQIRFEENVFISTQDGGTLLGSNCPATYSGDFVGFWLFECVAEVEPRVGEDQSETESRYRAAALDYIDDHIADTPRVMALRVGRTLGLYRPNQMTQLNVIEGRDPIASWIANVQFWSLIVLSAVGLRRWPTAAPRWPIVVTFGFTIVMTALSYGNSRFRTPADIGLVVCASVAIVTIIDAVRSRRQRLLSQR